jgi:hypothetical protein
VWSRTTIRTHGDGHRHTNRLRGLRVDKSIKVFKQPAQARCPIVNAFACLFAAHNIALYTMPFFDYMTISRAVK